MAQFGFWLMICMVVLMGVTMCVRFVCYDEANTRQTTFNILLAASMLYIAGIFMYAVPLLDAGVPDFLFHILKLLGLWVLGLIIVIGGCVVLLAVIFVAVIVFDPNRNKRKQEARRGRA
ncbi:MAG: hypothetical protein WCT45_00550 [Candidatus Paceibacterota bacterium]|jgi:hypothetical protein